MSDPDDEMPPASPALAGTVSLVLVAFALLAVILAAWQTGDGVEMAAKVMKKGLLVAVPLSLVALLLGLAGRRDWRGKLGLAISVALLLGAAALFAWLSFA